jgi:hypothetical protein
MNDNVKWVTDKKVARTMEALKKNNMDAYHVGDQEALHKLLNELIQANETVSFGGSMTLFETKTLDWLRGKEYTLLDRYKEGLSPDDIQKIYRDTFYADTYVTSTNAVTEDGQLYNVDGNGNRVAAMIFGPKQVIVIAGTNKIVKDHDEAIERNRRIAAPANTKRLSRQTPCLKLGYCTDCNSPDRICNAFVTISKQGTKDRIKVIFVDGQYGY